MLNAPRARSSSALHIATGGTLTIRSDIPPDQAEKEAFRFAGAVLLPYGAAREPMRTPLTLRVLMAVKAHYGASLAMSARRALDLGLITRDHVVSLQKQLSARRWRQVEPIEVAPEKPILIGRIVSNLAGSGSVLQQADQVALPVFTYRSLVAA
jgi:Zn-dependent peptidase ImmA (M78 family)